MTTRAERPGYRTTEFWGFLATLGCATALAITHTISESTWALAAGLNSVGYMGARAAVKVATR